ncbi:hypothetical protein GOP47_0030817, partial [Adiantum capillus-veneris]
MARLLVGKARQPGSGIGLLTSGEGWAVGRDPSSVGRTACSGEGAKLHLHQTARRWSGWERMAEMGTFRHK